MNDFKYVFGPIASRRLGRSLGISPLPVKVCNYSCIYCQLGRTNKMTNTRQIFFPTEDIIAEFKAYLKDSSQFDIVTVCGEGEPTLCLNLGEIIRELKKLTDKPVAVITNGALLSDPQVREDLMEADIVMPSLDAGNAELCKKIDRPHGRLNFEESFRGLEIFTHAYTGELWMEIMLIDGMNDDDAALDEFKARLDRLRYSRLYLNTPVRPPVEDDVGVISSERMAAAVEKLGGINLDIMASAGFFSEIENTYEAVKSMIQRHPMSQSEILGFAESRKEEKPSDLIHQLKEDPQVDVIDYKGMISFRLKNR